MTDFLIKDETPGRLNALVKEIGGLEVMDGILKGTLRFKIIEQSFLTPVAEITIPAIRNPRKALQPRKGLWVSDNFKKFVLPHIGTLEEKTPEITLSMSELAKPANDAEIMGATGEPMDATVFGYALDHLISQQPNGKKGFLPTDGRWIIIHVRAGGAVFAVRVRWSDVSRGWGVRAGRLRDARWRGGHLVVSLATA